VRQYTVFSALSNLKNPVFRVSVEVTLVVVTGTINGGILIVISGLVGALASQKLINLNLLKEQQQRQTICCCSSKLVLPEDLPSIEETVKTFRTWLMPQQKFYNYL
jgi:hypothetical protein